MAAKNLALNKQHNLVFSGFESPQTPYTLVNLLKGTQWAADELKDYGIRLSTSITPPDKPEKQIAEIYRLAESGTDGFAIYPNHMEPMQKCIDDLVEMGKYVVTVNKDVQNCKRHLYVGCDYFQSGILAAEVLARMIPPGMDLAILMGNSDYEHHDISERYIGLTKKIERFPEINLLPPFKYDGSNNNVLGQYLEKILIANPNLGGIIDLTCELDLISRIVRENENRVRLVGFDLCDSIKNHMISHSIDAVIFQDMPSQGYIGVKNLYHYLTDESFTGDTDSRGRKLEVVYEGNLEFYI